MTEFEFDTAGPITVDLRLLGAGVQIEAADRASTLVTLTPRAGDSGDSTAVDHVRVEQEGDRIVIEEPRRWKLGARGGFDVAVQLPARSSVVAAVGAGSITMTGPVEEVSVKSGAGDVSIARCSRAEVTVGAGDVELDAVHSGARVKSGAGDVTVGALHGGDLSVACGYGDIRCGLPIGVAAELDLKSGVGSIDNRLEASDERPEAHTYVSIQAKTGVGDVRIERALPVA